MRRLRITLSTCALCLLALAGTVSTSIQARAADAEAWRLKESSGEVRLVRNGISPIALTVGDRLEGGDWIETGPDGRALLSRGQDRILVAPSSRIGLPRDTSGRITTRILQTLGTILLTVERQARQHFEVETPLLAAVVKGTTFTVSVEGAHSLVHVVEGLVEVRDLALGQAKLVRPGETGQVGLTRPGVDVFGGDRQPAAPATDDGVQTRAEGTGGGSPADRPADAGRAATSTPAASAPGKAAPKAVIRHALGAQSLDIRRSTDGLVRKADVSVAKSGKRAEAERRKLAKRSKGAVKEKRRAAREIGAKAKGAAATAGPATSKSLAKSLTKSSKASARALRMLSRAEPIAGPIRSKHKSGVKPKLKNGLRKGRAAAPSVGGTLLAPLVEGVTTTTAPIVSTIDGTTSGLGLP